MLNKDVKIWENTIYKIYDAENKPLHKEVIMKKDAKKYRL